MEPRSSSTGGQRAAAEDLIAAASEAGIISATVRDRLLEFASTRYAAADTAPAAPEDVALTNAFRISRSLAVQLLDVDKPRRAEANAIRERIVEALRSEDIAEITAAIAAAEGFLGLEPTPSTTPPPAAAPLPDRPPVATTRPGSVPAIEKPAPASEPVMPTPSPAAPPPRPASKVRPRPPVRRLPSYDLGEKLRGLWSSLSADFAANTLTYLGVLLSVVVIVVFFAFGYFGEAVQRPFLRPPIFIAVPVFFLGLAWLLRSRTGLPAAANAVGMIGALTLPIMLSALFRDGYHLPPDINGPPRWAAYAVVGVITAGVYLALALRHRIYAYLVAPILWAVAGVLGLYWTAGMSGPQLFTILAAILVGLVVASRWQESRLGKILSVPTVRIGVVGAPFVFAVAVIFAYNDAVVSGVASPALADLAWPSAIAAALMSAVLAASSGAEFAWEGLGTKTRSDLRVALRVLAYIAAGAALLLALSLDATLGWVGVALAAYGLAVWLVDRIVGGTGDAATWISRSALAVGLAIAISEPVPAIVAWSAVAVFTAARATAPSVRRATAQLLPMIDAPAARHAELWIPSFVAIGGGVARIVPVAQIPLVFLVAAAIAVAFRQLPQRLRELRSFATVPAAAFAALVAVSAYVVQVDRSAYSEERTGLGLAALAIIAALTMFPWTWRLPFVVATSVSAAIILLIAALEPGTYGATMIGTGVLIAAGLLLVAASFIPVLRLWALAHGAIGHLALYGSLVVTVGVEDALLVAVAAVVLVHGAEAVTVERGTVPFIEDLAGRVDSPALIKQLPGVVAFIALLPLTLLIGRQAPWIRAEDARTALLLSGLSIGYAIGALLVSRPVLRGWALALGYGSAAASLLLAGGTGPVLLVALIAGAVSTFVLALVIQQPVGSLISWVLAFGAVLVGGAEAGLVIEHLYRPFLVSAFVTVVASSAVVEWLRRRSRASWWVILPGIVGAAAVAGGVVGALFDDQWLWAWAVAAAIAMLALTLAHRIGGLIVTVWAYGAIAYVDLLDEQIVSDPVWLLPYAAGLIAVSAMLPGQRSWRFAKDPAPITQIAGLVVAAVAVALAVEDGSPAMVLAWTSLIVAALWVIRREEPWLHGAATLLVAAGADAGVGWLTASLAAAAGVETAFTELRRRRPEARAYAFVATALWGAAYASLVRWLDPAAGIVVVMTLAGGIAVSTIALGWWLARPDDALLHRWMLPTAALGQVSLAGAGLYANATLPVSDAMLAWAAVVGSEAVFVGVAGMVRRSRQTIWASTGLLAVSAWLFAEGIESDPVAAMWISGGVGVTLLTVWALLVAVDSPDRVDMWRWPVLALAQGAMIASAASADAALGVPSMYGMLLLLAVAETVVLTAVATALKNSGYALIASGFALAGVASMIEWRQLGSERVVVWLGAMVAGAVAASIVTRYEQGSPRLVTWMWPLHAAAVATGALAAIQAARLLAPDDARLVGAVIASSAGIHILVNRRWVETFARVDILAPLAFVTAAGLGVSALDPDSTWSIAVLLGVAALGLAASARAGMVDGNQRFGWEIAGVGLPAIALVASALLYEPVSAEVGYVLIFVGGAFAAFSITARDLLAFQTAVLTWLAALLVLIEETWKLEVHAAVVMVAVVLLFMLDVERFRRRREGLASPDWLPIAEWAVMASPLALAVAEMVVTSLVYGFVLAAEGAALIVWGGLTTVRRRALMGLVAVTAAILLSVLIPLIQGVRGGLTGGWWLVVGAIAAVVFIAAGSLIEKFRTRVGHRLAQWGEILEEWE